MPDLNLSTTLQLAAAEARDLRTLFGCADDQQLRDRLNTVAAAAIAEYVDMFLGRSPIGSAVETRERRLIRLVREVFGGAMPPPGAVAGMFGMTASAAGAFVRTASAKHRGALAEMMSAALRGILDAAAEDEHGVRTAVIHDPYMVTALNDLLRQSEQPRTSVRRGGDSLTKYVIDPGSFTYLRQRLG